VLAILLDGRQRLVNADCWVQGRDLVLPAFLQDPEQDVPRVFGHVGEHRTVPVYIEVQGDC